MLDIIIYMAALAEWSKALRSGRSLHLEAWVRTPQAAWWLHLSFCLFLLAVLAEWSKALRLGRSLPLEARVRTPQAAQTKQNRVGFGGWVVEWPSGLRRQVKVLVSSEARVQIPSQPICI